MELGCRPVRVVFETESGARIGLEGRDLEVFLETLDSALALLATHLPGAVREWNELMERKFRECRGSRAHDPFQSHLVSRASRDSANWG